MDASSAEISLPVETPVVSGAEEERFTTPNGHSFVMLVKDLKLIQELATKRIIVNKTYQRGTNS